jgi:hypothetical protein
MSDYVRTGYKKIWGDHCDYAIMNDTDDYVQWYGCVNEVFRAQHDEVRYGKTVLTTRLVTGSGRAANELYVMLCSMFEQKEHDWPSTIRKDHQSCNGSYGGEHAGMLNRVIHHRGSERRKIKV